MKKKFALALALVLALGAFTGCSGKGGSSASVSGSGSDAASSSSAQTGDLETITVGASSTPHAEILEQVKDSLAQEGYDLKIVVYDDYVLPNRALADGSLDANYFQHTPYLNSYNASNGTDLVSAAKVHYEPFGLYGNGVASVADIQPGATILRPAPCSCWPRRASSTCPRRPAPRPA